MKHQQFECNKTCEYGCQWCDGGLFACKVCNLMEGSLTSDCPGYAVSAEVRDAVYEGRIDFRNTRWETFPSKYSPTYAKELVQIFQEVREILEHPECF